MRVPRIRLAAGAALTAAFAFGGFVAAPPARAAITGSQITTPSDPSFVTADEDAASQTFAIAGTTTGGNPATDEVAVRCYFGTKYVKVAGPVPLNPDGTFSVLLANLNNVLNVTCRLRAVPVGTAPTDLTPYSGPLIGVGEHVTSTVKGGPNNKKAYDYFFDAQQKTAAFDYASLGRCGVADGYLYDATLANTTITFGCNAGLLGGESPSPTRSEVQVDGTNAYAPASAFSIDPAATGLPTVSTTYSVNPVTGDAVLHETDPLVKCASATYPPSASSCPSFVSAGVTDSRTITQDHGGHVSWISDAFTSTDGKSHTLDLLWDNSQRFWGPSGNSAQLEYELPGQSTFEKHVAGDAVSLHGTPGTILLRMSGAPDGDMATGRGAIVYDRPATVVRFTRVTPLASELTLHETGSVPAGESTSFRFAYVQAYRAAAVASLARTAHNAFLHTLAVSRSLKGQGKVTSSPRGIACGKVCAHGYGYGTRVRLKATPSRGSRFVRWSGACSGTRKCVITVTGDAAVRAEFALRPCVVPAVVGESVQAAKRTIRKRFCSVGRIRLTPSAVAAGRVVSQTPRRGKRLAPRARINLVVSSG